MSTAEETLARQRAQAAVRKARYKERHPERARDYDARRRAALNILKERHRDEYLTIAATLRGDGEGCDASYRKAKSELRLRHAEEWADLLAAAAS